MHLRRLCRRMTKSCRRQYSTIFSRNRRRSENVSKASHRKSETHDLYTVTHTFFPASPSPSASSSSASAAPAPSPAPAPAAESSPSSWRDSLAISAALSNFPRAASKSNSPCRVGVCVYVCEGFGGSRLSVSSDQSKQHGDDQPIDVPWLPRALVLFEKRQQRLHHWYQHHLRLRLGHLGLASHAGTRWCLARGATGGRRHHHELSHLRHGWRCVSTGS